MKNKLTNIVGDADSLQVQIDNLNDLLVGFCFIRNIDKKVFGARIDILHSNNMKDKYPMYAEATTLWSNMVVSSFFN
jgi:hypothetical protein